MDEEEDVLVDISDNEDEIDIIDDNEDDNEDYCYILGKQKGHELVDHSETYNQYESNYKVTRPYISKFERIKIIALRAQQLANGANPTVVVPSNVTDITKVAELEYKAKRIPFMVRRYRPDNSYEDWRLKDFVNVH